MKQRDQQKREKRKIKDALPVYTLPMQRTANPRLQEVISKLDDSPNFRQVAWNHMQYQIQVFYKLTEGSYKVFPTRQQIYEIQNKLKQKESVATTQYLIDIIRNQQSKQHETVTTLDQLHLEYVRQRQGLTLYLDQQ